MKKYKSSIILFIILILNFSSLFIIINVKGLPVSDISYTFDDNILFDDTITSYTDSFNLKNVSSYTEIYNASYSFTNETDGSTSANIFVSNNISTPIVSVINNSDGHDKILSINSDNVWEGVYNQFTPQTIGIIEFWIRLAQTNQRILVSVKDTSDWSVFPRAMVEFDETGWIDIEGVNKITYTADTWYHVKIDIDVATDWHLWINGVSIADSGGFGFGGAMASFSRLNILSLISSKAYLDGIGYSWLSNYTIGLNILPFLNESIDILEVDRYEFTFLDVNTFNTIGSSNPNNWIDLEEGSGGDKVVLSQEIDNSFDRMVFVDTNVINDARGIIKGNLNITGNFINVSVGFIPLILNGNDNSIWIRAYSSDNTFITGIEIKADLSVFYNITGSSVDTGRDVVIDSRYDFNLLINYEIDRALFIFTENNIVLEIFEFPLMATGKEALLRVEVFTFIFETQVMIFVIDYVGIYSNGISQVDNGIEFGMVSIELEVDDWNLQENNLVSIIANGSFGLGIATLPILWDDTFSTIKINETYDNTLTMSNLYDVFPNEFNNNPDLLFIISGRFFNLSYLKIDGVLLNQTSTISHSLEFEHGSVDTNESFFSVVGNILLFTHTANDSNLEFIQAGFSINPISSDDFSLSFVSVIQDNSFGFLRVNFTEVSNLFQIPNIRQTSRFIISQNRTINDFIVLITDRNDNSITGQTTGSVEIIELLITLNIGTSIITASLINMMIPIIMILIPTLALSNRYGKNLIIPMFLLMSVICVVSVLIPVWLFFIIVISNSVFLLKKRDDTL